DLLGGSLHRSCGRRPVPRVRVEDGGYRGLPQEEHRQQLKRQLLLHYDPSRDSAPQSPSRFPITNDNTRGGSSQPLGTGRKRNDITPLPPQWKRGTRRNTVGRKPPREQSDMEETLDLHTTRPTSSSSSSSSSTTACRGLFTATELAAAELLVQLSGSSASFSVAATAEDRASSSSPRSVNARPPPETTILVETEEEEETGPWRRNRRYRPIADLYAVTLPSVKRCGEQRPERKRRMREK
ncbi:hypothetical protein BHE74_00057623, partial [Ensete ventricosum]